MGLLMQHKICSFLLLLLLTTTSHPFSRGHDGVLYEYFPSSTRMTSDVLRATLTNEDLGKKIKILPENRDIILQMLPRDEISLVYAIAKEGPVSLAWSSCSGVLQWGLFWRPHSMERVEVLHVRNSVLNETTQRAENRGMSLRNQTNVASYHNKKRQKRRSKEIIKILRNNFSSPLLENPSLNYIYKRNRPILEVEISRGEGSDPWLFQKEVSQPGLYVIKVRSVGKRSKLHVLASTIFRSQKQRDREQESLKAKEGARHDVRLSWASRSDGKNLFCLAVSRHQFHSSLCAAREQQKSLNSLLANSFDRSLILGCTPNTHYDLPVTPNVKYYLSIWQQGSLIPLTQARLQVGRRRRPHRLRPGIMVQFTLTSGGQVNAKFKVRKTGKKLHVAAVSCYGEVKVVVMAGKERVAAAKGREALHLAVRHAPKAKLTIKVSPQPPLQALYRVHLVATHSARRLPIPRLPKHVQIKTVPLNCSSAKIKWFKSPGGATYCLVLQRHPSGRPPEIRPPLQCGWEEVIRRHEYFYYLECFSGTKARRQYKILTGLDPEQSFLVNILVRHPVTKKALTLSPAMLNLPPCKTYTDNHISASLQQEESSFNYKTNFILGKTRH